MADYLAKTEQEKSVLTRLRLTYIDPLKVTDSNSNVSAPTQGTRKPPTGISSDAAYFNGKWYRVYEEKLSWKEARDKCQSLAGQLVLVPDEATQTFVKKLAGGKLLWLGATDEKKEGEWLWVDGTEMKYNYFHPVEPNNFRRVEHYLGVNYGNMNGFWCDFPDQFSEIMGYICEWPDEPVVLTSKATPQDNRQPEAPSKQIPGIVGAWKNPTGNEVVEFRQDGTVRTNSTVPVLGKWKQNNTSEYVVVFDTGASLHLMFDEHRRKLTGTSIAVLREKAIRREVSLERANEGTSTSIDRPDPTTAPAPQAVPQKGAPATLFRLIPEVMRKRCSKHDRLPRLKEYGGTPACEEAVVKGLRWLKANQNSDGSWGAANQSAMTGLALLAYFGHCETPVSEEFGDSCLKGITYLVDIGMKNQGRMASNFTANSWVYEHGIATYAIGEAATFCKELKLDVPSLMEVAEKAGQFIIDKQNKNGGWAYTYVTEGGHTDSSIVGWQLQALKACKLTGIKYKGMDASASKGLEYLSGLQADNGSFGYNTRAGKASLTGVGALCFQMWGKANTKEPRSGVKFIKDNFKLKWDSADSDLYAHYYASQTMMQAGGNYWPAYNIIFRDQLLSNLNEDGSWKAPAFTGHGQSPDNAVYRNALCILMLEVYYRFLSTAP